MCVCVCVCVYVCVCMLVCVYIYACQVVPSSEHLPRFSPATDEGAVNAVQVRSVASPGCVSICTFVLVKQVN